MKIANSIPDPLFASVGRMTHRLHLSQNEFFTTAARSYLNKVKNNSITEKLNKIYPAHKKTSSVAKEIVSMQAPSISGDNWRLGYLTSTDEFGIKR